jgi:hypothetical protein
MKHILAVLFLPTVLIQAASHQSAQEETDKAVEKALAFIASQQKDDGTWSMDHLKDNPLEYYAVRHTLFYTALNGLALFAAGDSTRDAANQRALQKAREATIAQVRFAFTEEFLNVKPPKGKLSRPCDRMTFDRDRYFGFSLAVLFLAHIYQTEKSDELRKVFEEVRDYLIKQQLEDGGWNYKSNSKTSSKQYTKYGMPFITTTITVTLFTLKHIGIALEDKVFERIGKFYTDEKIQRPEGPLVYTQFQDLERENCVGRTCASLWPMYLLGLDKTETFKKAIGFVEKNLQDADLSQHSPAFHLLWSGLACLYSQNKTLWKNIPSAFGRK